MARVHESPRVLQCSARFLPSRHLMVGGSFLLRSPGLLYPHLRGHSVSQGPGTATPWRQFRSGARPQQHSECPHKASHTDALVFQCIRKCCLHRA